LEFNVSSEAFDDWLDSGFDAAFSESLANTEYESAGTDSATAGVGGLFGFASVAGTLLGDETEAGGLGGVGSLGVSSAGDSNVGALGVSLVSCWDATGNPNAMVSVRYFVIWNVRYIE
jgi:hypothetical protein